MWICQALGKLRLAVLFTGNDLSLCRYQAIVPRYREVEVEAVDPHGRPVAFRASGWQARILQHECDHVRVGGRVDGTRRSGAASSTVERVCRRQGGKGGACSTGATTCRRRSRCSGCTGWRVRRRHSAGVAPAAPA